MFRIKTVHLFYILIFLSLTQYTFGYLLPIPMLDSIVSQFDDLFIIILGVLLYFQKRNINNSILTVTRTPIDFWLLLLSIFFPLSAILNHCPAINILLSFKSYFMVWFVFFFILWFPSINIKLIEDVIKMISVCFYGEFFLQIIQIIISIIKSEWGDDVASGTFPGANALSYAYFFPLFFSIYLYLMEKNKRYFFKSILFFLGMVMSWGMYAIMSFPFIFLFFNSAKIFQNKKLFQRIGFGVCSLFFLLTMIMQLNPMQSDFTSRYGVLGFFSPQYVIDKFSEGEFNVHSGSARLLWYPVTLKRLDEFAFHPLIGMGPGMYASYVASRLMPEPHKSIYNMFHQLDYGYDADIDSQVIPIWGEFGYIGIGLTIIFLIFMSMSTFKVYKKMILPFDRSVALTASASSIYLLFGIYTNHLLEAQPIMILYIIFCASTFKIFNLRKEEAQRI